MRYWLSIPVRAVLVALVGLSLGGCASVERTLLFHPVRTSPADSQPPPPPIRDEVLNSADGNRIHARWYPGPAQGCILYCPGNAGNLEGRGDLVSDLVAATGASVLIFDYPGFGRSEGSPSEAGCYAAADAAYRWLVETQKIRPAQIILYGESLGGGVAVEQASRRPHRALVLVRTFASIPAVAEARIAAVTGPLVRNRFDNEARLGQCTRPVLIAQACADSLIPFAHGERLRRACGGQAELHRLYGLDHNDPLPPTFYARLREFLQSAAVNDKQSGRAP